MNYLNNKTMKRILKIHHLTAISLLLLLVAGFTTKLSAKSETEKIVAEKTYKVNTNAQLIIDHEFGTLECKNWEKNEILVRITARIDSDNEEKIDRALSRVQYTLSGTADKVTLTCSLNNKGSNNRNANVSVNVEVMMPRNVRLDVTHKFGSGYIGEVDGISKVVSEYGSMTIGGLNAPESKLKLSFGEGRLDRFGGGSIQISYSRFNLGQTTKATVNSEYSNITIDAVEQLSLSAEGGDVEIGKVDRITGSSEFGSLKIDKLTTALDIRSEYGSLIVKGIESGFSDIVVQNSFGSAKLFIDANATYSIDAEAEFGSIEFPASIANLTYREKTTSTTRYKGVIGKDTQPGSSVKLFSEYGSISLIAD
jgi:hypothetical protein